MKFISNIDKDRYSKFVINHSKSHFLQSYEWGEFASIEKNMINHYVGMVDDNDNLVCTSLLLEKKLPFGYSYFYAPRGFVIDFNDYELVNTFVNEIKKYVKMNKAIFIKIDPDLVISKSNNDVILESEYDKDKIISNLKKIGFKHLGFTQKFETYQPRFSFRIDTSNGIDNICDNFSKTTKQRIKKAEDMDVVVRIGEYSDIEEFYKLMRITENRKDFITHNLSYYQTLYNLFKKIDGANLFIGEVDLDKIISKYEEEKNELNKICDELEIIENRSKSQNSKLNESKKRLDKINKDLDEYKSIKDNYGSKIILNGHYIIKYGDKAWVLYAGNHNILTDTYSNYKTYLEHIKYYSDKVKVYDQFGTVGKIDKDDHLYGLHEFKRKFGGDYVEFIGEFDLVLNKFMYFVFTKLVPMYRNIIKNMAKRKNR